MASLVDYQHRYDWAVLERTDGILEVRFHTNRGPWVWNEVAHRELTDLFRNLADDRDNRVVIMTGTGDSFLDSIDAASFGDLSNPLGLDKIFFEGRRQLEALLSIETPVISAINGPFRVHTEIALLNDINIVSDTAVFGDIPHFPSGVVPGDGVNLLWLDVLGPNRARSFFLLEEEISAEEAKRLGVVAEVVPQDKVLERAREVATGLAKKPPLTLRYTKMILTQHWREKYLKYQGYGMMMSGNAVGDLIRMSVEAGEAAELKMDNPTN